MNFWRRTWQTWISIITKPKVFFSSMPIRGGLGDPVRFALVLISLFALLSVMTVGSRQLIILMGGVVLIASGMVRLFISAGFWHFFVMLAGGRNGFEATFRVCAYASAVTIFSCLPVIGQLLATVWGAILFYIGIRQAHKLSVKRAVFVVLIPYIIVVIALITGILGRQRSNDQTLPAETEQGRFNVYDSFDPMESRK